MTRASTVVGIVGAILLGVGIAIVGAGAVLEGLATQAELNCQVRSGPSCIRTLQAAANTTVQAEYLVGAGYIVAGVGLGLFAMGGVSYLALRARETPRSPPSGPRSLDPPRSVEARSTADVWTFSPPRDGEPSTSQSPP